MLKSAVHEARSGGDKPGPNRFIKLLENVHNVMAPMLTKMSKLKSLLLHVAKILMNNKVSSSVATDIVRSEMVDAGTHSVLTVHYW